MRKIIFWFFLLFIAFIAFTLGCTSFESINSTIAHKQLTANPSPGFGAVKGIIKTKDLKDLNGLIVYLGDIIQMGEGFRGGFLDPNKAPYALIDPHTGIFFINNVRPGTYSLIIYEVVAGGKIYQDVDGNAIEIQVKQNELTDLGVIEIDF